MSPRREAATAAIRMHSNILYAANAITEENVSASESLLADADLADEMVEFSRSKILEQANLSVMAQANMTNQSVLKLL